MKMKKLLLLFAAVSLSSLASAADTIPAKVPTKLAFQSGGLFIYSAGWDNRNTCTNTDAIVLRDSDPNYDKAYALILAAYMSGKTVSGWSDDCHPHDGQTYNYIRGYKYLIIQ